MLKCCLTCRLQCVPPFTVMYNFMEITVVIVVVRIDSTDFITGLYVCMYVCMYV